MKKHFFLWALLLFCTIPILASDFIVNGIYYNILGGDSVEVTYGSLNYEGDIIIPATVKNNNTTYRVTMIGDYAFNNDKNLTSITIPQSVRAIENCAFNECRLDTINFMGTIDEWFNIAFLGGNSHPMCNTTARFFLNNVEVTDLVVPESVDSIPARFFHRCPSLQTLTISNSVKVIDDRAFAECSNLTSVILGENVEEIGSLAFYKCMKLSSIKFPKSLRTIGQSAFMKDTSLISVIIPEGLTHLGYYVFENCSNLTDISLPNTLISIRKEVFVGCGKLNYTVYDNAKYLGNSTNPYVLLHSLSNDSIVSCTIPKSTNIINHATFSNCSTLVSITILIILHKLGKVHLLIVRIYKVFIYP